MKTIIFGNPQFADRTQRSVGGSFSEDYVLEEDTLFIRAGSWMKPFSIQKSGKWVCFGATPEIGWQSFLNKGILPDSKFINSVLISAKCTEFNKLIGDPIERAIQLTEVSNLNCEKWVDPQMRTWFDPNPRILLAVTSLQTGGAEKVVLDIYDELRKFNWNAYIAVIDRPGRAEFRKPKHVIDLSDIPWKHRMLHLSQIFNQGHFDLLHGHLFKGHLAQELSNLGVKQIHTMHNMPEGWQAGWEDNDVSNISFVLGCSTPVFESMPWHNSRIATNGVAENKLKKLKCNKTLKILAIANPREQKCLYRMPKIAKYAKGTLTLAGEASKEKAFLVEELKNECKKHKVKLTLLGSVNVPEILHKYDVLLSTSNWEGLSISQMQALSSGVPVVSTDVGGAKYLGDGISLISVDDAESNPKKVAKILNSVKNNIATLPNKFLKSNMGIRHRNIYNNALYNNKASSDEIWFCINNFSMGGAQTSCKNLIKNIPNSIAFTWGEKEPTQGTIELRQHVPVHTMLEFESFFKMAAINRPKLIVFWNCLTHVKFKIVDTLTVPCIDVSPGEMLYESLDKTLLNSKVIETSLQYGKLLKAGVVKYTKESNVMKKRFGRSPSIIPNGVEFAKKRLMPNLRNGLVFGTACRIHPTKGVHKILEALKKSKIVNYTMLIAGTVEDEEYFNKIKDKYKDLPIQWLGKCNVDTFLPKLHCFLQVSEPAGCPNSSLEALARGIPVIATNYGGMSEQLPSKDWLVNNNTFSKKINEFSKLSPKSREKIGTLGQKHVRKNFSMKIMIERYSKLFENSTK